MASQLKILIDALWAGKGATQQARADVQALGNSISQADIQSAALAARQQNLAGVVRDLGQKVADGTLSIEQAQQAYSEYTSNLTELGEVTQKATGVTGTWTLSLASLTAGIGIATAGTKLFWNEMERGAELELAASRFDRLTASIGSTSDVMLNDLRRATMGMVSDADLMSSANELIRLRLAKTREEVVNLATVSGELGWNMNQLGMIFTNESWRRLDTLGLSIEGVREHFERLRAEGVDDATAFRNAVVLAGEDVIETMGGMGDSGVGSMRRLTGAWDNLRDQLSQKIAAEVDWEQVEQLTENINDSVDAALKLYDVMQLLGRLNMAKNFADAAQWIGRTNPLLVEYREHIEALTGGMYSYSGETQKGAKETEDFAAATGQALTQMDLLRAGEREMSFTTQRSVSAGRERAAAFMEQWEASKDYSAELAAVVGSEREMTFTTQAAVTAGKEAADAWVRQQEAADLLAEQMSELEQATVGYFEAIRKGGEVDFSQHLYDQAIALGLTVEQAAGLAVATGMMTQAEAEAAAAKANLQIETDNLAASYKAGVLTAGEVVAALDGIMTGEYATAEAAIAAMLAQRDYNEELELTPEEVETVVELVGASEAEQSVEAYNADLGLIPTLVTTTVRTIFETQYQQGGGAYYDTTLGTYVPGNNASGTDYWRGGPTWVGEQGPELLWLPQGSRIASHQESMAMAGGGGLTIVQHFNSREAAALGLAYVDMERQKAAQAAWGLR